MCKKPIRERRQISRHHQIPNSVINDVRIKYKNFKIRSKIRIIHSDCHSWIHKRFTNTQLAELTWNKVKRVRLGQQDGLIEGIDEHYEKPTTPTMIVFVKCKECFEEYNLAWNICGQISCVFCHGEAVATFKERFKEE